MVINWDELTKNVITFSKKVGSQIVDGGKKCWEQAKEHPEIVIEAGIAIVAGVLVVYFESNDYEVAEVAESNSNYLVSEANDLLPSMNGIETVAESHNYPENRKSPNTHLYRYKGNNYVRGGSDEDKLQFKKINKALFE